MASNVKSAKEDNLEPITSEEEDHLISPASYEILTYPADYTLEVLVEKLRRKDIVVPPFQRRYVWKPVQASKLIESFLLGLPVPPVFLYTGQTDGTTLVVDGQQRLRSIRFFFDGYFGDETAANRPAFRLVGLHPKSKFLNKTFRDLEETDIEAFRKLNDAVLRSFVVKQLNPKDDTSIYYIFERLNTGGTFLQGQEIRNCIYPGSFNDMLHQLNSFDVWRELFGKKSGDKRQRDTELILRFLALHHNLLAYEKPMKDFLNKYMAKNRRIGTTAARQFKELFKTTAKRVLSQLGPKPFHVRAGLNAAAYDSIFVSFAKHPDQTPADAKDTLKKLLADKKYSDAISSGTTDTEVINRRIDLASKAFFGTNGK
jgi:hypothetical protein